MKAAPGRLVSKAGMEALRGVAILAGPPRRDAARAMHPGWPIKIEDGDGFDRGTWAASVEALRQAGVLDGAGDAGARPLSPADAPRSARPRRCRGDPRVRARTRGRADRLTWPDPPTRPGAYDTLTWPPNPIRIARSGWPDGEPRRGQGGLPPAGQGEPPGCRRRGGAAAVPRHPGRVRAAVGPTPGRREAGRRLEPGPARPRAAVGGRPGREATPRIEPTAAGPGDPPGAEGEADRTQPGAERRGRRLGRVGATGGAPGTPGAGGSPSAAIATPKKATLGSTSYDEADREAVRAGLGGRQLVRHDERHVLDDQSRRSTRTRASTDRSTRPGRAGRARAGRAASR